MDLRILGFFLENSIDIWPIYDFYKLLFGRVLIITKQGGGGQMCPQPVQATTTSKKRPQPTDIILWGLTNPNNPKKMEKV